MMADAPAGSAPQLRLDYTFRNPELLARALTHTSAGAEVNYERLEFLGDRVLALVVAELLLERFPGEREGQIGRRFAELVRAENLARVGRVCGIDAALTLSGDSANDKMIADATEAVIAALYLDGGYPAAARFIEHHWSPFIARAERPPRDAKTALQEWSQARGLGLPVYQELGRAGPDHKPLFTVAVSVADRAPVEAQGRSKRAAEQVAAAQLLAELEAGHDD